MTDKKENIKEFLIDILGTLVGAFLMATATSLFLLPNQLSSGGFAALNIPLFLFAGYKLGKSFFIKSMVGTISFSVFIDILDKLEPLTFDRFLACIYGGIIIGLRNCYNIKIKFINRRFGFSK